MGPVDWPAECPGLKTALGAFYAAADDVARDLFVAFARAARLDASGDGPFAADASALADRFLEDFGPARNVRARCDIPGRTTPTRAIAGGSSTVTTATAITTRRVRTRPDGRIRDVVEGWRVRT